MAVLDEDTRLEPAGAHTWVGEISDRWSIFGPNGGYLASFITRALMAESPFPDPLTMTVHYVAPASPGPATVEVEEIRAGRSHATLSARLIQAETVAVALATFGRQRPDAHEHHTAVMPVVPPPDECRTRDDEQPPEVTIRFRFDHRLPPDGHPRFGGPGGDGPIAGGWKRMIDRELDDLAIPLFMDSWPASIWAATGPSPGAPTVELTVHWRAKPQTPWHLVWFRSPMLTNGYVVEDGELWGSDGTLIAQSRQLARFIER